MKQLLELFRRWWSGPPARSVEEIVGAVFPEDDRAFAIGFYKAWYEDEFLELKLGRGYEGLTRESFYDDAWFNFFWPPNECKEWTIICLHAEDELKTVVVMKESGAIWMEYDGPTVELAENFRDFIAQLRAAGWRCDRLGL